MSALLSLVCLAAWLYILVIFATIVISWFPMEPGSGLETVSVTLRRATEPVLGPVRRALPPVRLGAAALDLSPIVVLIGLRIVQVIIGC